MKYTKSIFVFLLFLNSMTCSTAQNKVFTNDQNVAVNGYDLVAYFNEYKAVRGSNEHTVIRDATTYYFSSPENATAFKSDPNSYLPLYGGYCSFAMAMQGAKVPADPQTFKIRDGKLYLFYNDFYEGKPFNTMIPWNGKEAEMIVKANTNWKKQK